MIPREITNMQIEKEMFSIDANARRREGAEGRPVLNGDPMLGGKAALVPLVAYVASLMADYGIEESLDDLLEHTSLNLEAREAISDCMRDGWLNISRELASYRSSEDLRQFALGYDLSTATAAGKAATDFYTPDCISYLALAILDPKKDDTIADLGCGWGGLLVKAHEACPEASLYGIELNRSAYALASARLDLAGAYATLDCADLLHEFNGGFNKAFCQSPLGIRARRLNLNPDYLNKIGRPFSSEWVFTRRVCDALPDDGQAVVVIGNGAAFNHADAKARAQFVEAGLVKSVIGLSPNLLRNTSVSLTMLVLGHGCNTIRMVDATDLSVHGRRWNTMGSDEINEVLNRLANDTPYSADVAVEAISAADYELSPSRYLAKDIEMVNPTPLEDLALSIDRGVGIKAAELDNLTTKENTGISYLPVSEVGIGMVGSGLPHLAALDPKLKKARLYDGDLVVTKISMSIRAAVADIPEGETVIVSGNLYIIRLDKERIDPYFLAAFLASEDGEKSLSRIVKGTSLPTISASGLRDLKVPLPSLGVQKSIAARYEAALDEIEVLSSRIEKAKESVASAYDEGMGR